MVNKRPQPRPELIALLDAVKDHPDEDTPRLVLADWLDEQDNAIDAERAKFIRAQIAKPRAKLVGTGPKRTEFLKRWLGPIAEFAGTLGKRVEFFRGLPVIKVHGWRLAKPDVPALLASEPFAFVQLVTVTAAGGSRMAELAAIPELRYVPGLGLNPEMAPFRASEAATLFGSPNLTGLRQINTSNTPIGIAGAEALANNPALARLRKVSVTYSKLVDGVAVALANAPHFANLQCLCLSGNHIGDAGAEALANSPRLANLRELDLHRNPRLTKKGKQLLRDKFGDRARV